MDAWWFPLSLIWQRGLWMCEGSYGRDDLLEAAMSGILLSMCLPGSVTFDSNPHKHLWGSPQMILARGSKAVACVEAYVCLCMCVCVWAFKLMYSIHYHLIIVCIVSICLSIHALACACVCQKVIQDEPKMFSRGKAQLVLTAQNCRISQVI